MLSSNLLKAGLVSPDAASCHIHWSGSLSPVVCQQPISVAGCGWSAECRPLSSGVSAGDFCCWFTAGGLVPLLLGLRSYLLSGTLSEARLSPPGSHVHTNCSLLCFKSFFLWTLTMRHIERYPRPSTSIVTLLFFSVFGSAMFPIVSLLWLSNGGALWPKECLQPQIGVVSTKQPSETFVVFSQTYVCT